MHFVGIKWETILGPNTLLLKKVLLSGAGLIHSLYNTGLTEVLNISDMLAQVY
jgi:hypothetical protein